MRPVPFGEVAPDVKGRGSTRGSVPAFNAARHLSATSLVEGVSQPRACASCRTRRRGLDRESGGVNACIMNGLRMQAKRRMRNFTTQVRVYRTLLVAHLHMSLRRFARCAKRSA